jgi:hypothetical protein
MIRAIKVSYDTSNLIRNDFASPPSALSNDDQVPLAIREALRRYAGIEPGSEMGEPT